MSADTMSATIKDYINREIKTREDLPPVEDDTKLIETGILDSLSILKLVLFVEDRFSLKVAPGEVVSEHFETVSSLCRFLRNKQGSPPA